jgi:phosphoglycerate-specific signal transduction histidine kinase
MPENEIRNEKVLADKGLAFFGAVMASISHELNNVVGIVDQSAGLLEDLLYVAKSGKPLPEEKLQTIAERVTAQTQRGIGLIKRMNKFAHSADEPVLEYDLNEYIENLVELTRRKATLKKAELNAAYTDETIKITGSPFLMQEVVYTCIMQIIADAQPDDSVSVTLKAHDNGAQILIKGRKPQPGSANDIDYLELMINRMNAAIESEIRGDRIIFKITVPKTVV